MRRQHLFDEVRQKWVVAMPEEIVRQSLVQKMVRDLGYPKELLALEKDLKELPHLKNEEAQLPSRRADLICFAKGIHPDYPLFPLLLIECKERGLTQSAREQVIGYNYFVKAPFIGVVAEEGIEIATFDKTIQSYHFQRDLPSYLTLLEHIS